MSGHCATASFNNFPILPPTHLSLTAENAGVAAVWGQSESDGGSPIASYTVTVFQQSDLKAKQPIAHCTVPPDANAKALMFCNIAGLVNGTTY